MANNVLLTESTTQLAAGIRARSVPHWFAHQTSALRDICACQEEPQVLSLRSSECKITTVPSGSTAFPKSPKDIARRCRAHFPGRAAACATAPPQIRTSGFPASGSSELRIRLMSTTSTPSRARSLLSALSTCYGTGAQSPRRDASTAAPRSGAPLPYSQAPIGSGYPAFNRYYEGAKTSLAHPAGFGVTSPSGTTCDLPLSSHPVATGRPRGLETFSSGPRPDSHNASGGFGISQVPRQPPCAFALLSDPGQTPTPGPIFDAAMLFPLFRRRKLSATSISGLYHTAFALAVYASCRSCPTTTQDSLPAGGQPLPDGIGYPLGCAERFQIYYHPPFLSLTWRNGTYFCHLL